MLSWSRLVSHRLLRQHRQLNLKLTNRRHLLKHHRLKGLPTMYSTIIEREQDTDGCFYWLAWHPELDYVNGEVRIRRCLGSGNTAVEAQVMLEELSQEFIDDLIEDGLPIPAVSRPSSLTIYATLDGS